MGFELCMGDAHTLMRGCIYIYIDCCVQDASARFIHTHIVRSKFSRIVVGLCCYAAAATNSNVSET